MLDKLNSSGRLLITTPNRLTEFLQCLCLFIKRQKRTEGVFWDKTHISVKTLREWLKILQAFHNIKVETLMNFVIPWLGDRSFAVKVRVLHYWGCLSIACAMKLFYEIINGLET